MKQAPMLQIRKAVSTSVGQALLVTTICLNALWANPVQVENAKTGTTSWQLTNPATNREIEGYASLTSVNRGSQIKLFVSTAASSYTLQVYRLGWYKGSGGRQMTSSISRTGILQTTPAPDPDTGLTECNWTNPYTLTIPYSASDLTLWASGVYVVKLTAAGWGKQSYVIFVVRDDARVSDYLMQSSVTTFQAYNNWGGKSLYSQNSTNGQAARKVSFNRPYGLGRNSASAPGVGAGEFLTNLQPATETYPASWECPMVQFLEGSGYDVAYCTNIDTHGDANLLSLSFHKGFLSVGHDEYWSWEMRHNVRTARDNGLSLGFFSANTCYWQIRLEPSTIDSASNRVIVGYKQAALTEDPIALDGDSTNDNLVTTKWRNSPVNLPEDSWLGVMYEKDPVNTDMLIINPSHWLFANTTLRAGDKLTGLLGYEVDRIFGHAPTRTTAVAHSPYTSGTFKGFSDMTVYTTSSGATVFATGSMHFCWGLSDYGVPNLRPSYLNTSAKQITSNVLASFVASRPAARPSTLPSPWTNKDIGSGRYIGSAGYANSVFTLNTASGDIWNTADAFHFVYRSWSGDGEIIARVVTMQNSTAWAKAGVMIRETLSSSSRHAMMNMNVGNGATFQRRTTTGGSSASTSRTSDTLPFWVRLVRAGSTFTGYKSSDGVTWTRVGSASIAMPASVYIGLAVSSNTSLMYNSSTFSNIRAQ
jgi:hypothetical protein